MEIIGIITTIGGVFTIISLLVIGVWENVELRNKLKRCEDEVV